MVYEFVVNYTLSLIKMIEMGAYDWVGSDINEANFSKTGEGEVTVNAELIHFNRFISSDDAVIEMDKIGFRPATTYELLAFGVKNPDVQREFPVVSLGSPGKVDGDLFVAYLGRDGSERGLDLGWWNARWYANFHFLGVRKPAC